MLKRTLLPLVTAAAVTLSLVVAGCSQSDAAGTEASMTLPIYTPSVGSGDPVTSGAGSASADRSTGMTTDSAPSGAAGTATTASGPSGSASGAANTGAAATSGSGKTVTVMPTRATVTLASSLVISMTVAPGVDTSGIDIEGAKNSYYGFASVSDSATIDPTKDWRSEFAKFVSEPLLSAVLAEIADLASDGVHDIGHAAYFATAIRVKPDQVTLRVCNDNGGSDTVDAKKGGSVKSGYGNRHPQDVTLTRTDGRWFVSSVRGYPDQSC